MRFLRGLGILFIFLILSSSVLGAVANTTITYDDLRNSMLNEQLKTRQELKKYVDDAVISVMAKTRTETKAFIDENFVVLENRMRNLFNLFLLKIVLAFASGIVLSQITWFIIKRALNKIGRKRREVEKTGELPVI
jgi:capsular polysaccharide biosynthesis protein